MSGIFGLFQRDGAPVNPHALNVMRAAMADWGRDGISLWRDGAAGLGQARSFTTPEARYEALPSEDPQTGFVLTAAGRVDNRDELGDLLGIPTADRPHLADGDFIFEAYRKWGDESPAHIHGDWAFAAWRPAERKLFVARDHYGNTALYYHAGPRTFAFASSQQALLALNLAPVEMDELYLAQVMVSWVAYCGERTIRKPVRRLPPAHCLTVTPERLDVRQYWRLEDTPELRLPRREDYVAAFRDVFDQAVRARVRSLHPVGATLSGGLDSSSVTATAAGFLRAEGKRLPAFTSVPLSDTASYVGPRFGDEFPFAQATARHAANVDLQPVAANGTSPIQAIRRLLEIHLEPVHSAANAYWMLDLEQTVQAHGCRALLTGQMGNGSISWTGESRSQPLAFQVRQMGLRKWAKFRLKRTLPPHLLGAWSRRRRRAEPPWPRDAAIHPGFAERLDLLGRWLNDPDLAPPRTPRDRRERIVQPGRSLVGVLWAQTGAVRGLEARDPTADARVLAFTFSVPDRIYMDPGTGVDRWLIREAMKDRLPDEVRLNRRRGRQAGDLVPRLRACSAEVEIALDEIARGPAAAYVDVSNMRAVWRMVQTGDTPEAFHKAVAVLTRGIMAGLFVNEFYR